MIIFRRSFDMLRFLKNDHFSFHSRSHSEVHFSKMRLKMKKKNDPKMAQKWLL